ncbi:hypothetical protein L6164_037399 [Bauhinia variegata]|uniref:Uncharacterized protein n=1 Tax=Bauhinia variegata TaxID=167791 RepID=A0ACB9KK31_BAUVA|nr:hypothetical protein L6164_037399 [Bauhinia variegata]
MRFPEKIKIVFWLVLHGSLPVNQLCFNRHLAGSALCARREFHPESIIHCCEIATFPRNVGLNLEWEATIMFSLDHQVCRPFGTKL